MLRFPTIHLDDHPHIRGVIMDVDDTLYDYENAHRAALDACATRLPQFNLNQPFNILYRRHRDIITARFHPLPLCRSRLLAFQGMFEELGITNAYDLAQTYDHLYWDTLIDNMLPTEGAKVFLEECSRRAIPVCALTDMLMDVQVRKLRKLGLTHLITHMVTSEEVGIEKGATPANQGTDPMFAAALRKLGNPNPHHVMMIGDSATKDIAPAKALGMEAFQVVR